MEAGATIDASATQNGDGGKVVLWSDIHNSDSLTSARGDIKAEGGTQSGTGGKIETSGHKLVVDGITISTKSSNGKSGEWLLDPYNITITGADNNTSISSGVVTASANSSTVSAATIVTALGNSDVTISTTGAGTQTGDIKLPYGSGFTSGSANKLTLSAAGSILLGDAITRSGSGGLDLIAVSGGLKHDPASSSGAVVMSGGATVTINQGGDSNFAGKLDGTGGVTKEGAGTLDMNNGRLYYTGLTTIKGGTFRIYRLVTGAGVFASSGVVIESGGTLDLPNNGMGNMYGYLSQPITLSGTGVGGNGAITASYGYQLNGMVTLAADASIGGSAGLVLAGGLTGSSKLTKVGDFYG
jgi:autotransporter-associated beta strand protein